MVDGVKLPGMRVVLLALSSAWVLAGGLAACAQGREPLDDDDGNSPIDARINSGGDGGGGSIDARIDAPGGGGPDGSLVDAPVQTDAPTTGGVECPDTIDYYFRAIDELSGPNPTFCSSGAECSSAQCCYGAIVCVPYP